MPNIMTNVRLFTGGADLTGQSNKVEWSTTVDEVDVTHFSDSDDPEEHVWREVLGGLFDTQISAEGFWEAGDSGKVDDASWQSLGLGDVWSLCPMGAAFGQRALLTKTVPKEYKVLGEIGKAAPWTLGGKGAWPVPYGRVLHEPGAAETATGEHTGFELGAVPAGKHLYAALHVLSVAGTSTPTITVAIESDVDNTFSSPNTQLTFTPATARSAEALRVAGPITDTWYRAKFTITGSTPSFLFLLTFGVAK